MYESLYSGERRSASTVHLNVSRNLKIISRQGPDSQLENCSTINMSLKDKIYKNSNFQ